MIDTLTIVCSRTLRLAKLIHADGTISDYDNVRTVDLAEVKVDDLADLRRKLERLLTKPNCAVVFGAIADQARTTQVRRLAYPDPNTADLPTLTAVARWWFAMDMDGIARPEHIEVADLLACAAEAIKHLPAAFHGVRCIVQATSSHGIKDGCRLRIWFWLSRPTTGEELGIWLKGFPVDPCTFRPAQLIYTAAPVFVGRSDHLPCRLAELPGAPCVEVPPPDSLKPPPRPAPAPAGKRTPASAKQVDRFIDAVLARVRAAPDGGKHYAIRNAARSLGGIQAQAGFTDAEAVRWLLDALPQTAKDRAAADKTARWGLDVGRHAEIPLREPRPPDPRRRDTARAACRLLRMGVPSAELLDILHEQNGRRSDPLPDQVIGATALWAAKNMKGRPHA
jgi:hypothetical protein